MTVTDYILKQASERQPILTAIHTIILHEDKTVTNEVGLMMGKEMVLYKEKGYFKYGLASVKNYMSIHSMPIYGCSTMHARYQQLLLAVQFQKGCINFKAAADVPLEIIKNLFAECAKVSIAAMLENRKR